ncbi:MAG: hypothetical protein J5747_11515 [Spirochaetaceae bacterium]|nr:hypothetical protein [Spirochaetaceae bacterium]
MKMNKCLKISSIILIVGLVIVISSCSMFGALGKVFTRVQNGENPIDDSYTVKAILFEVNDAEASEWTTSKPATIIEEKRVTDMNPNSVVDLEFENAIQEGTKVKLFIALKTKTTHHYYRGEAVFVIQEGVNVVETLTRDFVQVDQDHLSEVTWAFR